MGEVLGTGGSNRTAAGWEEAPTRPKRASEPAGEAKAREKRFNTRTLSES